MGKTKNIISGKKDVYQLREIDVAKISQVYISDNFLTVRFSDKKLKRILISRIPELKKVSKKERQNFEVAPFTLSWNSLDLHLSNKHLFYHTLYLLKVTKKKLPIKKLQAGFQVDKLSRKEGFNLIAEPLVKTYSSPLIKTKTSPPVVKKKSLKK